MKIIVLGGSGLVGNAILEKQWNNFEIISTNNKNKINIQNNRSVQIKLPEDFNHLNTLLLTEKPDVVINTIAYSNVDFCESHKDECYSLHVKMNEKISTVCSKINSRLIFLSTDYVFDGKKGNYSEGDIPNPVNYYGYTKMLAEKLVLQHNKNTVVRTSSIYGWGERIRFLNFVLHDLRNKKEVLAYNNVSSTPTLIDDLVDALFEISKKDVSGILHVVGSSCLSRFDFVKAIAKKFKLNENLVKPISVKNAQLEAERPENTCLTNNKARKDLGVNFVTIEEGLDIVLKKSNYV